MIQYKLTFFKKNSEVSKLVYIPEETLNSIRSQANIKDIVGHYVDLSKAGQNYFAHCPFHEDNTPSFSVNEQKQIYKCFSCGRGGNVFQFIQEIDNISFPEAVLKVAELANVPLDQSLKYSIENQGPAKDSTFSKLVALHEQANELYHHILMNAEVGETAYDYLQNRGITRDIMEEFELGYSPKQRESLAMYLNTQDDLDTSDELMVQSGLFSQNKEPDEPYKDRFANRIMFPLRNHQGRLVGFSGRIFEDNQSSDFHTAKYLNSPETPIFNKRRVLFNFYKAKQTIRKTNEVVLFEGYMDVIAAWSAGVHNGVASMGTSLTTEHIQTLSNVADTVILAFDGDNAGIEATKKTAEFLTTNSSLSVEIVSFPNGADPDEYIKSQGADAFNGLIDHGRQTLYQFIKQYYRKQYNLNNDSERIKYIELMISEIAKLPSAIERDMHAKELADEFNLPVDSILSEIQTKKTRLNQQQIDQIQTEYEPPQPIEVQNKPAKKSKIDRTQELLLHRIFYYPEVLDTIDREVGEFDFATEIYQRIYLLYLEYSRHEDTFDHFIDFTNDQELKQKITDIMWITLDIEPTDEEIMDYLHYILDIYPIEKKRADKEAELKEAKQQGNIRREEELTMEIIKLNRQLKA